MKYLFLLTVVTCFALPTVGQTPSGSSADSRCSLTREQAPEIRGIRLGMSTDQILGMFPDDTNRQRITEAIKDSKRVDSVTSVQIEYAGTEWKTVDQFVAKLSEGLRLPSSSWERGDLSSHLKCDGFRVEAYAFHGSTQSLVRVRDTAAPQVVEDRREAAKEKARQAFKP